MEQLPTDLGSCSAAIPAALEEMMQSHNSILQISQYCKDAYAATGDVSPELMNQTKQYTSDALLNVAYHIHKVTLFEAYFEYLRVIVSRLASILPTFFKYKLLKWRSLIFKFVHCKMCAFFFSSLPSGIATASNCHSVFVLFMTKPEL
jgi:hypothetical protein